MMHRIFVHGESFLSIQGYIGEHDQHQEGSQAQDSPITVGRSRMLLGFCGVLHGLTPL
jgi:hypothetical protein